MAEQLCQNISCELRFVYEMYPIKLRHVYKEDEHTQAIYIIYVSNCSTPVD